MTYRILVTGSRSWADVDLLSSVLDDLLRERGNLIIVHGDCPKGADAMARAWVRRQPRTDPRFADVKHEPHPAHWHRYGNSAGIRRNAEMVALGADLCLCFATPCADERCTRPRPHDSHGASDCAAQAAKAGIPVRRFAAALLD